VAAAHEAFRVAFATNDVRTRPHAPGDDAHIAFAGANGTFARHQDVLSIVALARHIVVVAIDRLQPRKERAHFAGTSHRVNHLLHHQIAVRPREVLRPLYGFDVIFEVLRAF
jgi:hypothetical protein